MDAAQVLQTVLSVIQSGGEAGLPSADAGAACPHPAASATQTSSASLPASVGGAAASNLSLPQLLLLLLGTSAVRDWIKLLLIGAFFETCRRFSGQAWTKVVDFFWVTVSFEIGEDCTVWLLYWLSQQKVFHSARNVEVTSAYYDFDHTKHDDLGEHQWDESAHVSLYPSLERTYSTWYKGRYILVNRERLNEGGYRRPREILHLRMLTRDTQLLRDLIIEARTMYKLASEHLVSVYVAESAESWIQVATQEKRPCSSVILDPGVMELVLDDARDFLKSKKWYADRGIPHRRGYLLYGAPGAGKTSMIHSIAGELDLNVYILSLTVASLDDNSLKALISRLPVSCIVLIEDIDAAFTHGMKRDIADPEAQARAPTHHNGDRPQGEKGTGKDDGGMLFHGVTLSGLLNALDGIAAQEGRILFATTNDYSALDPALLRPGRLDLHIEFQLASRYQATELFKRFYTVTSEEPSADEAEDEKDADEKAGKLERDSGYSSRAQSPVSSALSSSDGSSKAPTPPSLPAGISSAYAGALHTSGAQLSRKKAAALAERFADIIPPHAFSMATLQGYLMAYKVRPYDAVADAPAWVEKKLKLKGQEVQVSEPHASGAGDSEE
ncbi:P-loop containing nucleoside triphosphate hydrolase protein [Daedaleopsis nitida]|nr:P-loop containing nucleoside triphosphate hydrolase protein [Daedaleopsis nitida]